MTCVFLCWPSWFVVVVLNILCGRIMHAPVCCCSQDSNAQRLHTAAHWYFQGPVLSSAIDYSSPWFPMAAEANRGLEEAFLRRGEGEVDGELYQVGSVSYHANFTLMMQARKHETWYCFLTTLQLHWNVNALFTRLTPRGVLRGTEGMDPSRWL